MIQSIDMWLGLGSCRFLIHMFGDLGMLIRDIWVHATISSSHMKWTFNSLWPSDAIWRQGSWSTLVQVMACCLTAPSHYLNQCWLIITKRPVMFIWGQFRLRYHSHHSLKLAWNYLSKILLKSPRGQWVNRCTSKWKLGLSAPPHLRVALEA